MSHLKKAYELIKAGEHGQAEILLARYVKGHKNDYRGWWLMANATKDEDRKRVALQQVLRLQPDHQKARMMLDALTHTSSAKTSDRANSTMEAIGWSLIAVGGLVIWLLMGQIMARYLPEAGTSRTLFEFGIESPNNDSGECSSRFSFGAPRVGSLRGLSSDSGTATFDECSPMSHRWTLDARADERYAVTLESDELDLYVLRVDSPPDADTVSVRRRGGTVSASATFETSDKGSYGIIVRRRSESMTGTYEIEVDRR